MAIKILSRKIPGRKVLWHVFARREKESTKTGYQKHVAKKSARISPDQISKICFPLSLFSDLSNLHRIASCCRLGEKKMSTKTDSQSVWMHVIGGATSSNRLDKRKTKFTKRILPLHIYSDFLRINFFPLCNRHTNEQADICTVRELTFSFFSRQLPTLYHSLLTKVPKPARSS